MKVAVMTLGCKVNKYESDSLIYKLKSLGIETTDKFEEADVYIINTCAVTKEAERKSRQMIARCKKFNENAKIFICGCASQHNSKQFFDKKADLVIGTSEKLKLIDYLKNLDDFEEAAKDININNSIACEYSDDMTAFQNRIRAYIKIQDGCNNFCSYCIIPYLRGRSRSRDLKSILEEAQKLGDEIKEVVVTGINVSDFKIDNKNGLLPLLQNLDKFGKRIRLSSMEETLIDESLAQGLSKLKNFCPHFHLSLQSGSDSVLKRMNRHYTTSQFKKSVELLRRYFPKAGITTDLIVGFPDETDEEFEETFNFVKEIQFSQLHIFKYSPREGTLSYKIYKDLPFSIKQKRLEKLEKLGEELKKSFIEQNKTGKVLIEEKQGEFYIGYTENYIKCFIQSESDIINQVVTVEIIAPFKDGALARIKNCNNL